LMITVAEKVCGDSCRITVRPEVVSREHLATLLVSGVDNALRYSANLFEALSSKWAIRPPIHRIGA
jgi:hypothetical protein